LTKEKILIRIEEAGRLKLYRKLCGLKQYEAACIIGVDQFEYCKKENGYSNIKTEQVEAMKRHFTAWREAEIKRLTDRIDYLKSIV